MRASVELAMEGGERRVIAAEIFGDWAVHQGPRMVSFSRGNVRLAWQITHVPTGMGAFCSETCGISKKDAFKIARRLARCTFVAKPPDPAFGREVHQQIQIAVWGRVVR